MDQTFRRCALLLFALLAGACESEGLCRDSGISRPSAPPPPLYGTWEGHEAPRVLGEPAPSWRFKLDDTLAGTFVTDRAITQGWFHADTLRGPVSVLHCYGEHEMYFEFDLRYPRTSEPVGDTDYYVYPCTIEGQLQGGNWRIDGLLACRHHTDNRTDWRAIYPHPARRERGDLPHAHGRIALSVT